MSETIKTGWIKDEAGNKLAPKTVIGQVLNKDGTVFNPVTKASELDNDKGFVTTDTKNTTGATDTDTGKLYLVGASSQDDESQTYTDKNIFIDESHDNLYSKGYVVRDEESGSLIFQTNIYGEYAKAGSSGIAQLTIGSSRDLSQDGDYIGHIYQYSDNYHYTDLVPASGLTTNPVIILPNKSGTLATTDEATKSEPGLMSATDKSKLSGIYPNASNVMFNCSLNDGNKIGDIVINGNTTAIFSPITSLKVGTSSTATVNETATNGNVYLNVLDGKTVRDSHNIVGSGATTVTSDADGVITISSPNKNAFSYVKVDGKEVTSPVTLKAESTESTFTLYAGDNVTLTGSTGTSNYNVIKIDAKDTTYEFNTHYHPQFNKAATMSDINNADSTIITDEDIDALFA